MSQEPQTPRNQSASPAGPAPDPRRWGVLAAMGLGTLMGTLDMSVVNVSLPTLVEDLNTDFATIQWVILSYALVMTSLMLGAGRLGDMYGKKKLYLWGMAIFVGGSLLSGISPSVGWLIAFRAVQGFGAVVIQALGAAIITEVFPARERGRALGIIGSVVAVGLSMGPAIGGILIGTVGWRSIFLINVPVGLLSGLAVVRLVPRAKRVNNGETYDSAGAILLMLTLSAYALGMTSGQVRGFTDPAVLWLLGAAGLGLAMFLFMENRLRHPMLELKLFKDLEFSLSLLLGLMLFIIHASNFIIPFYLQLVLGYSTEKVGLLMMVAPLTMGLVSPVSGALSDRFGTKGISMLGLVMVFVGCVALSGLREHAGVMEFVLRMMPYGVGMGLFLSPNNSAIMGAAPVERLGVASGLLALSRTLGMTSGIPLMGAIYNQHVMDAWQGGTAGQISEAPHSALVAGIDGAFTVSAIGVGLATVLGVVVWMLKRRHGRRRSA